MTTTGKTAADNIRTETFRGQTYTVVPVVALVEGLLQGLNASQPEFAPADEFAKFPMTWNGRPVTLMHPHIGDELVSANDPTVLEQFQIGFLANTERDGTRLKTEAWLDEALIEALGASEMLDTLKGGDSFVEVSTGLFTDVVTSFGSFNGKTYQRAWSGVVPDHLAFLPGSIGACSVSDGCGAPRLNAQAATDVTVEPGAKYAAPLNLGRPHKCCTACDQGEPCMSQQSASAPQVNTAGQPLAEPVTPAIDASVVIITPEAEAAPESTAEAAPAASEVVEEVERAEENDKLVSVLERFVANAIPSGMTFENAREIVQKALRERFGDNNGVSDCGCYHYRYTYILGMTSDMVAFERWVKTMDTYETVAVQYSVDENGGVSFTGEPVPVNLIVQIVPRPDANSDAGMSANEGASGANQEQEENAMSGTNEGVTPASTVAVDPNAAGPVVANGAGAEAQPAAPRTLEQYLEDMPPELRAHMQEGIALRTQQRNELISSIVANSQGLFTEAELATKEMDELKKLQTLSTPKVDYSGTAVPANRFNPTVNAAPADQMTVPEAPKAFTRTIADVANGQSAAA